MAAHCSVPAWRMDRGAWRATVHGVAKSRTRWKQLSTDAYWVLGPKRVGNIVLEGGFPSSAPLLREKPSSDSTGGIPTCGAHTGEGRAGGGAREARPAGARMPVGGESETVPSVNCQFYTGARLMDTAVLGSGVQHSAQSNVCTRLCQMLFSA